MPTASGRAAGRFERLAARYDRVVEELGRLPVSLIHGEFHPSNVLVRHQPNRGRVCPVDWETVGIGPSLLDLAALVAGRWAPDQRTALARAYFDALPPPARLPWEAL